jgi:hypothetical protein
VTDTTPKTRTKNTALYAVEIPDAIGARLVVAYVRSTSTAEAKAAVPITARRLSFDEAARVLRSNDPIIGMEHHEAGDDRQLDLVGKTPGPSGAIPSQDVDHHGSLDKGDLPPVKTVNEALAAGVKVDK